MKARSFSDSLRHAIAGIRLAVQRERNFRIQITVACVFVFVCVIFRVGLPLMAMVAFAIFFVLAMELVNTAIEAVVDLACHGKPHPLAQTAKDVAAGAVLLASFFAIVVGIIVVADIASRYL